MKLWVWRWGFVVIHHSCSFPPFSLFFQSQLTATPGDRRQEATSEISLWEAAQYQNKLGLCFGQGTSDPGVMSTCNNYQIGTLLHVLKEPQIVVLNESAQHSPFLPEFGIESVWTPEWAESAEDCLRCYFPLDSLLWGFTAVREHAWPYHLLTAYSCEFFKCRTEGDSGGHARLLDSR